MVVLPIFIKHKYMYAFLCGFCGRLASQLSYFAHVRPVQINVVQCADGFTFRERGRTVSPRWFGIYVTVAKERTEDARIEVSAHIVQELCESRGGRPGLSVLTSLLFPWT